MPLIPFHSDLGPPTSKSLVLALSSSYLPPASPLVSSSRALCKFSPSRALLASPKTLLNTGGGSTTRPLSLLIGRPQKPP
ncbi:hypothetical protein TNCV_1937061 [Trichonephila clavipes]|nr:hypothetical protein TNCV_1937061 [Trichonephila clavipes]